jgi:oligoendopeptidase F
MATAEILAEGVRWDLTELCADAEAARTTWADLVDSCGAFAERYRSRVADLSAGELRRLLDELDQIEQEISRVGVYSWARVNIEVTDTEANDLMTVARDRGSEIENLLVFVELEWIAVDDEKADALLAATELAPYAHKLAVARAQKPYVRSEPEEQALNTRAPAIAAWQTLHDRQTGTLEIPFDAGDGIEPHTLAKLLSYVHRPERDLRIRALEALYAALEPLADVQAAAYDALVGDRLATDRLRGYPSPMRPTNMMNELDDEAVEVMLAAIEESYPIAHRWWAAKAGELGVDKLLLADQYAPVGESRAFSWDEAVAIVDAAFERFAPPTAEIFRTCLESGHVDAPSVPGKTSGAYCSTVTRSILPLVFLNFTGRARDVSTLAHEFGHATHDALALRRQTFRSHRTGLAIGEIPSMFAELVTHDHVLGVETDAETQKVLAAERLEDAFASIFRQTVLARFEVDSYRLRGEGSTLTTDRLSEIWIDRNARWYGDSLELPEGYRLGWSYIPHFIHFRFYTYAYSFAQLVALLLFRRYKQDPALFTPRYLELLGTGGAASPAELLEPLGVDLRSPDTWRDAFVELDALCDRAVSLLAQ